MRATCPTRTFSRTGSCCALSCRPNHTIDFRFRLAFIGIAGAARRVRARYLVERGGYFVMPDLEQVKIESATIMFNTQTCKRYIGVAWKLQIAGGQTRYYADFARALGDVKEG